MAARSHRFSGPPPANLLDVEFGDMIRLRGFEIDGELRPGQAVTLTLQGQALRQVPESYRLFLHLIDSSGQIMAQVDTVPQQGQAPTAGWLVGEIIDDELRLAIPPELPATRYRLVLGLYDETTGRRLMAGDRDQITLLEIDEVAKGQR